MNNTDEMSSLSSSNAFKRTNSHLMTFSLKVNCKGFAKKIMLVPSFASYWCIKQV